jgi:hypothetical protein
MSRAAAVLLLFAWAGATSADAPAWSEVQRHDKAVLLTDRNPNAPWKVKLSESLTLLMRIEGAGPLDVEMAKVPRPTEGWQLEAVGEPKVTTGKDGQARWEQLFKATPLQPGQYPLLLPKIEYTEKDGATHPVAWQPLLIQITTRVAKVDLSEARDLTGIEELLPPPAPPGPPWWPWLFALVPLFALVAFVGMRWRRRPALGPTARELALRQLAELGRLPLTTVEEARHLFTRVSEVLRQYIEKRFELPAPRRTTPEFFAALGQKSPLTHDAQAALNDVLVRCDLVKFAGVAPPAEDCQVVLSLAKDFVEAASLPLPPAPSPKGEGERVRNQQTAATNPSSPPPL